MKYAAKTKVPVRRSQEEIEHTLKRYGADQWGYSWDDEANCDTIGFRCARRYVRFVIPRPSRGSLTKTQYEQRCRQRWRVLALCIKAKLETVNSGVSTFEDEFLPHIVLPNGKTVRDLLLPQLAEAYDTGQMPKQITGGFGS